MTTDTNESISTVVDRAQIAQERIATADQARTDALVRATGWALYRDDAARAAAEMAVERTGVGSVDDKVYKTKRQVLGALADLHGAPSVGVVARENGLVDIAKPVGVVGAFTPATNPVATVPHLAMLALKGRNAIVFSPAPKTRQVCQRVVAHIRDELTAIDAPSDIVQVLDARCTRSTIERVAESVDFVQATASPSVVDAVQTSGTPNHGVAVGNVVAIVDDDVDVASVGDQIATSTVLDHGATCVNANVAVVLEAVADDVFEALTTDGGFLCTERERALLEDALFHSSGALDRRSVGISAPDLASEAGFDVPSETRFLLVDGDDLALEHALFTEKLSPVLTTRTAPNFETAVEVAASILAVEGRGHSCAVYANTNDHVRLAAERLPVGRIVVNQPSIASAGSDTNGLPFTLSLGGGTWAGNQSDRNLTYSDFLDVTTVAHRRGRQELSPKTVFEGYPAARERSPFDG